MSDGSFQDRENAEEELDRQEEYGDWLRFARLDYESAKYLYNGSLYPKPIEIICYHCQQAAEKAVKALIVYFGSQGGMPKVHDIAFLLNQMKNIVKKEKGIEMDDALMEVADGLSKYGVAPRYPNEIYIDDTLTAKAFHDATTIMEWVQYVIDAEPVLDEGSE